MSEKYNYNLSEYEKMLQEYTKNTALRNRETEYKMTFGETEIKITQSLN